MKIYFHDFILKLTVVVWLSYFNSGCTQEDMKNKDEKMVEYETNTYCIGRYLVDIPQTLTPYSNMVAGIDGIPIEYLGKGTKDDFRNILDKRAADLRAMDKPEWGDSVLL